jgi:hypothetical protein
MGHPIIGGGSGEMRGFLGSLRSPGMTPVYELSSITCDSQMYLATRNLQLHLANLQL